MASLVNGIIGEQYTKVHEDNRINNDIQQSSAQILGNSTPLTFEHVKFSNISIQSGRLHRRWAP
ncbi:unnamed protein product, partial [Rotaria socialis]